jgi:hypothetical protein
VFLLASIVLWVTPNAWASPSAYRVAFFYGSNPPVNELKAFDVVVVEPDSGLVPDRYGTGPSQLFAYVSVGEVAPNRSYARQIPSSWVMGDNPAWKTKVIDVSNLGWQEFFLDKIIEPLWQAGYRGFFLDTLDSYQIAVKREQRGRMEAGLVAIVRAIRQRHPSARLMLNRGFEVFDRVKGLIDAVAAESLYKNFNPMSGKYGDVTVKDREWLLSKLNLVKGAGIPVVAIDYVAPEQREQARQTAEKIKSHGFIPWVADKDLASLGVGGVEVMPRTILGLYDGSETEEAPDKTQLQRFAVMPLNHLGYTVKLHDLRDPLPDGILAGRYAGVVIWPCTTIAGDAQPFKNWVFRQVANGIPVVFLERFGVSLDSSTLERLGLERDTGGRTKLPIKVVQKESLIGFEQPPLPNGSDFLAVTLKVGNSILKLADAGGMISDSAAITPWGGYILAPFVLSHSVHDRTAWVIDPFRFFKEALRLPDMPVPDTTTENGVRLFLSHIDGDGFDHRVEWPGGQLAANVVRTQIIERYQLPTTVSFITSQFTSNGVNTAISQTLFQSARSILSLGNVEGASHSFSHPLRWKPEQTDEGLQISPELRPPKYHFDVREEILGSMSFINEQLMPTGKKARLILWTGNCMPSDEAVSMTFDENLLNMNGGYTLITDSKKSISGVGPLGISRGEHFQVFSPVQSENIYTNMWTGPFYGYRRIIETFRLTDLPRRLKPVNLYYHFISATKQASLEALQEVHQWAVTQRLFAIFASEYIEKVLDFNRTVIARDGSGWLVRNRGHLKELRIPTTHGYPDLRVSRNVAGFNDHGESRYIHLLEGGEAWIQLQKNPPTMPYLRSAGGSLKSFEQNATGLKLTLKSLTPFTAHFGNTSSCRIQNGAVVRRADQSNELITELPEGTHVLAIECR